MEKKDIRWKQRLEHYKKALAQLSLFIEKGEGLNKLEEQGLIKAFEYTYELSWNLLKDYYANQGEANIQGSRDAFRLAFRRGLIEEGETWMQMIESRILTVHSYNEETADQIAALVKATYFRLFVALRERMVVAAQLENMD